MAKLPTPAVPSGLSTPLRNFLAALTKSLSHHADLLKSTSAKANAVYLTVDRTIGILNTSIPPKPQNLGAQGAFSNIVISWDAPNYAQFNFAEIWRSDTNTIGAQAKVIGTTAGFNFADAVSEGSQYYYWVRFISSAKVKGPFSSSVYGETASMAPLKFVLTDPAGGASLIPFKVVSTAYCHGAVGANAGACSTAGGTWIPVGSYMDTAFIKDASIASAKIGSLNADKINATNLEAINADLGSITAGIMTSQSGQFIINLNNNVLTVHDNQGVLRVKLGKLI